MARKQIQIRAKACKNPFQFVFSCEGADLPSRVARVRDVAELCSEYRIYQTYVLIHRDPEQAVSLVRPNLYALFYESVAEWERDAVVIARTSTTITQLQNQVSTQMQNIFSIMGGIGIFGTVGLNPTGEIEDIPDYEVNMVEALVGWKSYQLGFGGNLIYPEVLMTTNAFSWMPNERAVAKCDRCKKIPNERHTCGIYAANTRHGTPSNNTVFGEIYGWGRYVCGTDGWRSEFAYPKNFILSEGQEFLIDKLKIYHVPIYIMQPLKIYSPEEEGYEYGQDNQNWYGGTSEESGS